MGPAQTNEAAYAALDDAEQLDEATVEALIIAWAHAVNQRTVLTNAQTYAVGLVHEAGVSTVGDLRAILAADIEELCGAPRAPARRLAAHFRTAYRGGRRAVDAGFEADSGHVSDPNPDPNEGQGQLTGAAGQDSDAAWLDMSPAKSPNATESEASAAVAALMANSTAQGELMVQVVQAQERMVRLQAVAVEGAALKAAAKIKELKVLEFPKARMRPEWANGMVVWLRDIQGKMQDVPNMVEVVEHLITAPYALSRADLIATVEPADDKRLHMAVRVAIGDLYQSIPSRSREPGEVCCGYPL